MERTFLNIPDNLRPIYFFHLFKGISSSSDTGYFGVLILVKKNQPKQILKGLKYLYYIYILNSTRVIFTVCKKTFITF